MNVKKLILSAVLPVLCLTTVAAQTAEQDNSPKKGDVTLAVTAGYTANTTVTAQPGNLTTYEVTPITDLRFALGVEGGWFVADRWKLSLGGAVNFLNNAGYSEVPGTVDESAGIEDNLGEIPNYRAVADAQTFSYNVALGFDRYFGVKGVKNMMLYTGLRVGFAYGQNQKKYDEWTSMGKSIAETSSLRGAWTFGVDYYMFPNMFIGVSIDPVSYTYNITTYVPQEGLGNLSADSHKFSAFAHPTLRVGFKF
jgi:opacity protein-like surface antigen